MSKKIIILGASAAGISALHTLRRLSPESSLLCISRERELPYNKCFLADYFSGIKPEEQLRISPLNDEFKHQFLLGQGVTHINPEQKQITLSDNQQHTYDALFLGLGSSAYIPKIAGIDAISGIFTFNTLADINGIQEYIRTQAVKRAIIIGAGLSGLECADSLRAHTIQTTVIEASGHILPSLISSESAEFIAERMRSDGIQLLLNNVVAEFTHAHNRITGVMLKDGSSFPADIVICATGLRGNIQLALQAGIITSSEGILVNEYMQTNIPDIFAGGDAIMVKDQITGQLTRSCMWPDAMMQGMIAAHAMAGKPRAYPGALIISCSAFFGLKFACYGMKNRSLADQVITKQGTDFYHQYLLKDGLLMGFVLLGNTHNYARIKRALMTRELLSNEVVESNFNL